MVNTWEASQHVISLVDGRSKSGRAGQVTGRCGPQHASLAASIAAPPRIAVLYLGRDAGLAER